MILPLNSIDWSSGKANFQKDFNKGSCVKLLAVGDVMLIDQVEAQIKKKSNLFPYDDFIPLLKEQDLGFCNLEALLSTSEGSRHKGKRATFKIKEDSLKGLIQAGFNLINVGNNHTVDFGPQQVINTIDYIRKNDAYAIGGGKNKSDAHKPVKINIKGVEIGALGYAKQANELNANETRAGSTGFILSEVIADVRNLKNQVDVVLVSVHWGWEFVNYPDPEIQYCYRKVIEAGADAILAHHPHFINGIEIYRQKPIFYSLGSFIMDFEPPLSEYELNLFQSSYNHNIAIQLYINKEGVTEFQVMPTMMSKECQIKFEDGEQKEATLKMLKNYSIPLANNTLDKMFWKESKNHLLIQFPAFKLALKENGFFALESILVWAAKPVIIKMLWGYALKLKLPELFVSLLRWITLFVYKIVKVINIIRIKFKKTPKDIFS